MSISAELAKRILSLRCEDLPEEALESARRAILDTVGVTLAGALEEATRTVDRVVGVAAESGSSLIFGSERRATCLDAALINGTAAHILDFDDCSNTLGGHPSVPILPAVLALAEEVDASGRDLLLAYIIGFETEARIASAVNFHHYQKGWHPTATLGIFGAAAACARLLGLPEERIATALSLSVSMAAGVKANFGTMTKSLHVGQCSRNGLFAALLSREGFTSRPEAFEHEHGFLNVYNGPGTFNAEKIFDHWADPLSIVTPGVAIKQYPCCGSTHPALDAMIEIVSARRIEPVQVSEVDVWIHARRLAHTNRPDPHSALESKFSLQYCLARALLHGKVVLEHFEGATYLDPEVRRIMTRVHAAPYTDAQFDPSNHFGAELKIRLVNGQTYSAKVQSALGRTVDNPLPEELLKAKFENCASRVLSPERVAHLYSSIRHIDHLPSIRDLTAMMANDTTLQRAVV